MTDITLKIQTPNVPNFVRIELPSSGKREDGFKDLPIIAIGDLSDTQLDQLAHDWKIKLFQNANRQREAKKHE